MKTDKRLKRGLADLSRLFLGEPRLAVKKREGAVLTIEPPLDTSIDLHASRLIFTSFLPTSENLEPAKLIQLGGLLKTAFSEVCVLTLAPTRFRYERFAKTVSLPSWDEVTASSDVVFHPTREGTFFAYISHAQFQKLARPETIPSHSYYASSLRSTLVIFDSIWEQRSAPVSSGIFGRSGLELMDHCIFVVGPDLNQLERTYELMRDCLTRNQALRCSLFVAGKGAEALWETVYEHFNSIVSQFLARDLGFLGWAEDKRIQLNPEFLMDEQKNFAQLPFKASLSETFCLPLLKG